MTYDQLIFLIGVGVSLLLGLTSFITSIFSIYNANKNNKSIEKLRNALTRDKTLLNLELKYLVQANKDINIISNKILEIMLYADCDRNEYNYACEILRIYDRTLANTIDYLELLIDEPILMKFRSLKSSFNNIEIHIAHQNPSALNSDDLKTYGQLFNDINNKIETLKSAIRLYLSNKKYKALRK